MWSRQRALVALEAEDAEEPWAARVGSGGSLKALVRWRTLEAVFTHCYLHEL